MSKRRCFFRCEGTGPLNAFPKEGEVRNQWLKFIYTTVPEQNTPSYLYLCSLRFTEDCFLNRAQFKAGFSQHLILKEGAVPTLLGQSGESASQPTSSVTFFKFPREDELKKRWFDFVSSHTDGELSITTNTRLCSDHFTPGSFTNFHRRQLGYTDKPLQLAPGALPTIALPELHPPVPPTCGVIVDGVTSQSVSVKGSFPSVPDVRHVASQTDPTESKKSVGTQLSMKTLQNHYRSTATQVKVSRKDCGVCTLTFPLDSPLLFLQPTIVERPSERPSKRSRLNLTDEEGGPSDCSLSVVVH